MINSLSFPAIKGAFTDYISETHNYEKEIEGIGDFATNIGYVLGPVLAGLSAQLFSNSASFTVLGIMAACVTFILLLVTPKRIHVKIDEKVT